MSFAGDGHHLGLAAEGFEDMKRLGDWEYVLGINLMDQHLAWMFSLGERKTDYPPTFSYQNPWWKHYRVLAEYFARLSAALSTGEEINRIDLQLGNRTASGIYHYRAAPLATGSWKSQGLPFYPGEVAYTRDFKLEGRPARYLVRLGRWSGTVAEVRVNGESAGIIGWQPYECEITSLVKPGVNHIEVIVTGSNQNRQGPHHGNNYPGRVGPADFHSAPATMPPGDSYRMFDYGLMEEFQVLREKEYAPTAARHHDRPPADRDYASRCAAGPRADLRPDPEHPPD